MLLNQIRYISDIYSPSALQIVGEVFCFAIRRQRHLVQVVVAPSDGLCRLHGAISEREWWTAVDGWTEHRVVHCQISRTMLPWSLDTRRDGGRCHFESCISGRGGWCFHPFCGGMISDPSGGQLWDTQDKLGTICMWSLSPFSMISSGRRWLHVGGRDSMGDRLYSCLSQGWMVLSALAAWSLSSLPWIPQWPGTHWIPTLAMQFASCWRSLFTEGSKPTNVLHNKN